MITHEQEIEIKNKLIEKKNDQIVKLEMEVERMRSKLEIIANGSRKRFKDDREFRLWVQMVASLAIGQKPGELTVKKGDRQ